MGIAVSWDVQDRGWGAESNLSSGEPLDDEHGPAAAGAGPDHRSVTSLGMI